MWKEFATNGNMRDRLAHRRVLGQGRNENRVYEYAPGRGDLSARIPL
jgi:hypothetical protein